MRLSKGSNQSSGSISAISYGSSTEQENGRELNKAIAYFRRSIDRDPNTHWPTLDWRIRISCC